MAVSCTSIRQPATLALAFLAEIGLGCVSAASPYFQDYGDMVIACMDMAAVAERIHHPDSSELDLARVLRAVGDPVRLAIVRVLADDRERMCNELQDELGLPSSTCSYHLRLLREAGVPRTRAPATILGSASGGCSPRWCGERPSPQAAGGRRRG